MDFLINTTQINMPIDVEFHGAKYKQNFQHQNRSLWLQTTPARSLSIREPSQIRFAFRGGWVATFTTVKVQTTVRKD